MTGKINGIGRHLLYLVKTRSSIHCLVPLARHSFFHPRMSMVPSLMVRKVFGQTLSSYHAKEDRIRNVQVAQLNPFWRWMFYTFSTAKDVDADFMAIWKDKLPRKIAFDDSDATEESMDRVRRDQFFSHMHACMISCVHAYKGATSHSN